MKTSEIQTEMAAAVDEVLGAMCLSGVLGSEAGSGALYPGLPTITAALHFSGVPWGVRPDGVTQAGDFSVSVPRDLARGMGRSSPGRDQDEVSDTQAGEVVCKLANMICGSVLRRVESGTRFDLSRPVLTETEPEDDRGVTRWFDLGGGVLTASLLTPA